MPLRSGAATRSARSPSLLGCPQPSKGECADRLRRLWQGHREGVLVLEIENDLPAVNSHFQLVFLSANHFPASRRPVLLGHPEVHADAVPLMLLLPGVGPIRVELGLDRAGGAHRICPTRNSLRRSN